MRKRTRRKHFDPEANPVRLALLEDRPALAAQLASLRTVELLSLAALDAGTATAADRGTLRRMCLVSAQLAAAGIGPEAVPAIAAAADALRRCVPGGASTDREALRELLGLYDQQREMASQAQLLRAVHLAVWGRAR